MMLFMTPRAMQLNFEIFFLLFLLFYWRIIYNKRTGLDAQNSSLKPSILVQSQFIGINSILIKIIPSTYKIYIFIQQKIYIYTPIQVSMSFYSREILTKQY